MALARYKIILALLGVATLAGCGSSGAATAVSASCITRPNQLEPNYIRTLLSPFPSSGEPAVLVRLWPNFPITVGLPILQAQWAPSVEQALRDWERAGADLEDWGPTFTFVPGVLGQDVDVFFTSNRSDTRGFDGLTRFTQAPRKATIWVATVDSAGKPFAADYVRFILLHEIGHALGISGHSPNPIDVMSLNRIPRPVSLGDINTLRYTYCHDFQTTRRSVGPIPAVEIGCWTCDRLGSAERSASAEPR